MGFVSLYTNVFRIDGRAYYTSEIIYTKLQESCELGLIACRYRLNIKVHLI
jgi:hypothetical protein